MVRNQVPPEVAPPELFPPEVLVVLAAREDQEAPLLAPEETFVQQAVEKRVREFRAGRACARRGMARLGVQNFALLKGPDRDPIWPGGIVGSITHCAGFVAAAVAPSDSIRGLGLDAEPSETLGENLVPMICTPTERDWLAHEGHDWAKALFSAKEAVFKCLYPVTRAWMDFHDVSLTFDRLDSHDPHDTHSGTFTVDRSTKLPIVGDARVVVGTYLRTKSHWITGAIVRS
jgi:4'-phosphopantetheinyl transferase EntD